MINFRASYTGNCIREIVSIGLNPKPEEFDPFLQGGHGLQDTVTGFLLANDVVIPTTQWTDEFEGVYTFGDKWKLVGHVDGIVYQDGKLSILEIKAIQDKNFKKLAATSDWRGIYGGYTNQTQSYMGFTAYNHPKGATILGPICTLAASGTQLVICLGALFIIWQAFQTTFPD